MAEATTTARIRLALEGASAVQQGLSKVEGKIGDLRGSVAALTGGLSAAGFAAWIKGAIDAADETGKMAQKTGLLTKEVAGLQLAFDQGGAGDKLQATLARLSKEASSGNEAFKAMGVTVTGTDGKLKSTRVLLGEVADKFAGYRDSAEKTALAQELFGKTGADIIPVLNGGAAALADYDNKAKALGLTLDDETTKAAEAFNDQMDIVLQRTQGVARQIASELLPTLSAVSEEFAKSAQSGGAMSVTGQFLSTVIETVSVAGANLSFVLQALARDGAAIYNVYANIATLDFKGLRSDVAAYKAETMAARDALDAYERRVMGARKIAESLKGAEGLDEPRFRRLLSAGGTAAREAAPHVEKLTGSVGRQRAATKALTEAEKELAEARKQDLAVGVLRNKQAEENYRAALQAADVEAQFRQIVIDKEREWEDDANEEKLKASREILEKQEKETADFWASVDSTAHDVFVSVANEGEDAFKRIGKTLKAAVLDMLYQMTIKKWIFQISGQSTGSLGSTGSLLDSASSAYSAYSMAASGGAGSAGAAGSMSAIGSYAGGSMSGANAAGSVYANATGTGINGLLATNGAYGTAASGSAAASSSAWMTAAWYAAVIVAAVAVAENLYSKGYNRQAVGYGDAQTVNYGRTSYTADPNMARSFQYDTGFERMKAKTLEWAGLSEKWVDILSGTTRMAATFGRKLGAYGYEANIAGGDVSVGGFARYKGGLFRSNKTVSTSVDAGDAAALQSQILAVKEGTRLMAQAMGLSAEAVDNYTGKLRVNFKGANTAAEQSERMAKAMDDLQYSMLKAASGGKMARAEFDRLMESVRADIESAGISTQGITGVFADGIMNGLSGEEIGANLSQMILGGIVQTFAQQAFAPVAQVMMSQIITPIFTAIAAGVPISQAVSKAAIQNMVGMAQQAMAVMNEVFNSAAMQDFFASLNHGFASAGAAAASVRVPTFRAPTVRAPDTTAADTARERAQLEMELLRLQGNTVELRRRELLQLKPSNRALQEQIWLLEDQQEAAEKLKDTWSSVMDAMSSELRTLRDEILGLTPQATAWGLADLTTAQAAALAGDASAAERIPEIARAVLDLAAQTSASLSDLRGVQGYVYSVLSRTQQYASTVSGLPIPAFAVGTNYVPRDMIAMVHEGEAIVPRAYNPAAAGGGTGSAEVVAELRAMRAELTDLKRINIAQAGTIARLQSQFDAVTDGGTLMRNKAVTV